MTIEEIWKDIDGFENYQVSNLGRVKSIGNSFSRKEKILKDRIYKPGYNTVILYKNKKQKSFLVHQLVAVAFLDHKICGHKLVVNHKDFNKLNNNVDNLEIVTARENSNQKHIKSISKYTGVSFRKDNLRWTAQIVINKKLIHLGYFKNEIDAHNAYQNKLKQIL